MNWRRIALLLRFDLGHGLLRLRAWVFLLPFSFFWFVLFRQINNGVAEILQSQEGIMITSAIYGTDGALRLFIDHPPSISVFYLVSLSTIPFFVVLAAYDQFSSDLGSGFFRFLVVRCRRLEIFIARFASAYCLVAGACLLATIVCSVLSLKNDDYPAMEVLLYAAQVYLTLLMYILPFIAYMSLVSAMVGSTIASMFLGFSGFAVIWFLNLFTFFTDQQGLFSYLLPSSMKNHLIELDTGNVLLAVSLMPLFTLVYAGMAFIIFNRRNL